MLEPVGGEGKSYYSSSAFLPQDSERKNSTLNLREKHLYDGHPPSQEPTWVPQCNSRQSLGCAAPIVTHNGPLFGVTRAVAN